MRMLETKGLGMMMTEKKAKRVATATSFVMCCARVLFSAPALFATSITSQLSDFHLRHFSENSRTNVTLRILSVEQICQYRTRRCYFVTENHVTRSSFMLGARGKA